MAIRQSYLPPAHLNWCVNMHISTTCLTLLRLPGESSVLSLVWPCRARKLVLNLKVLGPPSWHGHSSHSQGQAVNLWQTN